MAKKPIYEWQPEEGIAICKLYYNNLEFKGVATCHPDDVDMMNKLTGQTIAGARATLKLLKHIRNNELKPQLKILQQLYYSMNRSKKFNPKSYENKMLYSHIQNIKLDLELNKTQITQISQYLKRYIYEKEKNYQSLRTIRGKNN